MIDKRTTTTPSKLDNLRNREPYRVPENFFETLQRQVLDRISSEEVQMGETTTPIWKRLHLWIYGIVSAAAIAIVALTMTPRSGITDATTANMTPDQAFECLSDDDQEYLLDNFRSEISMEYIALQQ